MIKITGLMNQQIDQFFTMYDEEVSQWMRNTNRIPQKHLFLIQASGLDVGIEIKEFMVFSNGNLHIEGNLVLPDSWKNKTPYVGFNYDNKSNGVWAMLRQILNQAIEYANKEIA